MTCQISLESADLINMAQTMDTSEPPLLIRITPSLHGESEIASRSPEHLQQLCCGYGHLAACDTLSRYYCWLFWPLGENDAKQGKIRELRTREFAKIHMNKSSLIQGGWMSDIQLVCRSKHR